MSGGRVIFIAAAAAPIALSACHDSTPASIAAAANQPSAGRVAVANTPSDPSQGAPSGAGGAASAAAAGTVSFNTNFDLTESPISEKGAWISANVESTRVWTAGGLAFGTQPGNGAYNDSYAHLSGFPPNQLASGVIHLASNITRNTTHEVEILLRVSDGAHSLTGYECNFAYDGNYVQIVRWDPGGFAYLAGPSVGHQGNVPGGLREGDTVSAMIVGNVITAYVNGVQAATATDATYKTGDPGMAFWRGGPSISQDDFAFTRFSASSLTE